MAGAFATRASGLLVPAATLDKTQRTVLQSDFNGFRRLMGLAKSYGMVALYICGTCKQPVKLEQHDQIIETVPTKDGPDRKAKGGRVTLACDCTDWIVR